MGKLTTTNLEAFRDFFRELNDGHAPFPWQEMLLRRVVETGEWPEAIDLPTASGKTACLEIAVFALSLDALSTPREERAPRRIFFVVDRRIVVDAAYQRAERIRAALTKPKRSATAAVAAVLRVLGGLDEGEEALAVSRLRGGTITDHRWRENPARAAIITGTVDQVGSRLLFRGYGTSRRTLSIDAAMAGCDSLILVDEAHCAVPFLKTARAIAKRYSTDGWAEEPVAPPLRVSVLSATLPELVDRFPATEERDEALDHPELRRRIESPKRAQLAVAKKPSKAQLRRRGGALWQDPLVLEAADRALGFAEGGGHSRIGVMVNRVRTAVQVYRQLSRWAGEEAQVELMTGRMRPVDRDNLVARLSPLLASERKEKRQALDRPLILVTTQCLEVGADFSFDALVTECASLDALRQRFGRMDRLGDVYEMDTEAVPAVVLIRKADTQPVTKKALRERQDDPIYSTALPATWRWLDGLKDPDGAVDFGIKTMDEVLRKGEGGDKELRAPVKDPPVLLPAHLDAWCQTSPRPEPDPDPAIFLHGPDRGVPEVRVVFRSDLVRSETDRRSGWQTKWLDAVGLVPPLTAETLTLPLRDARRWLSGRSIQGAQLTDAETQREPNEEEDGTWDVESIPFLVWRGREGSVFPASARRLRPQDTIVVPAVEEWAARLGPLFQRPSDSPLDQGEAAYRVARAQIAVRLHPDRPEVRECQPLAEFIQQVGLAGGEVDAEELRVVLAAALETPGFPPSLEQVSREIASGGSRWRVTPHPDRGVVVLGHKGEAFLDDEDFLDDDDLTADSEVPVGLPEHSILAGEDAVELARLCLGEPWEGLYRTAGLTHDVGKADPRFQALLHGSELQAASASEPIAKGPVPKTGRQRRALRTAVGLPKHFRHEMVSMQLLERWLDEASRAPVRDLLLHLVASHHGHARPFAPVVRDDEPVDIAVRIPKLGAQLSLTQEARASSVPPERIDSGVADRFWRLTRRFGWWGLAYLESILRLADWKASGGRKATTVKESEVA